MARLLHRGCRRIEDQWTCLADVRAGCNIMHAHTQYRVLNGECLFSAGDSVVGLRLLTRQSDTSYLTRVLAGTPPPRMAEPPLHPSFMYRRTGHLMMINLEARDATGPRQSTHLVVHKDSLACGISPDTASYVQGCITPSFAIVNHVRRNKVVLYGSGRPTASALQIHPSPIDLCQQPQHTTVL